MSPVDISILIVTYDRADTLRQAIDSALMQSYPSKEILVVDDGSKDGTRELLESYGAKIRTFFPNHQGAVRARNSALALAQGRWIAYLDSDDYYTYPGVLHDALDCFSTDPTLDAISSGWQFVDPQGKNLATISPWEQAPEFTLESCLFWKPTALGAKIFRREILDRVGGFDPEFEASMDTDLVFRILLAGGKIGWLRKITFCYRQSPLSIMQNAPRQAFFLLRALDKVFASPQLSADLHQKEGAIRQATHLWLAWYLWSRGFPGEASAALSQARELHPVTPFIQLKKWWGKFQHHSLFNGVRPIPHGEFLSIALNAIPLEEDQRPSLPALFEWWATVWDYYSKESGMEGTVAPSFGKVAGRALVKMTQRCIMAAQPVPPKAVERFWRDAISQGAVPPSERSSAITLYLTGFVSSVYTRQFRLAAVFFGKAIAASGSPAAAGLWFSFFRSALVEGVFRKQRRAKEGSE